MASASVIIVCLVPMLIFLSTLCAKCFSFCPLCMLLERDTHGRVCATYSTHIYIILGISLYQMDKYKLIIHHSIQHSILHSITGILVLYVPIKPQYIHRYAWLLLLELFRYLPQSPQSPPQLPRLCSYRR